jgi:organic hydroperoxide reductase OsmC/OhrA
MAPDGYRDKVRLNPENLFVATVASAHMLSWLHIAFSMGAEIDTYVDAAEGVMTELEGGEYWISEVILVPKITFIAGYNVTPAAIAHIHELAQKDSFIAHSIKTKVTVRAAQRPLRSDAAAQSRVAAAHWLSSGSCRPPVGGAPNGDRLPD